MLEKEKLSLLEKRKREKKYIKKRKRGKILSLRKGKEDYSPKRKRKQKNSY